MKSKYIIYSSEEDKTTTLGIKPYSLGATDGGVDNFKWWKIKV